MQAPLRAGGCVSVARARDSLGAFVPLVFTIAVGCARETEADLAGRETYLRYCASCHGPDGRGDGPLAASLKTQPADLTQIAKRNGGSFDERPVMATIDVAARFGSTACGTCPSGARSSKTSSGTVPELPRVAQDPLPDGLPRNASGTLAALVVWLEGRDTR